MFEEHSFSCVLASCIGKSEYSIKCIKYKYSLNFAEFSLYAYNKAIF